MDLNGCTGMSEVDGERDSRLQKAIENCLYPYSYNKSLDIDCKKLSIHKKINNVKIKKFWHSQQQMSLKAAGSRLSRSYVTQELCLFTQLHKKNTMFFISELFITTLIMN